jgi:hypothetical protein
LFLEQEAICNVFTVINGRPVHITFTYFLNEERAVFQVDNRTYEYSYDNFIREIDRIINT